MACLELVPRGVEIVAAERDMLDALAIIGAQIFLDLALAARTFFVERDADLAVGGGHRLRGQAGIFALDVEIADLAIDHLTHNVYGGRMAHWAAFYERIAGFREIRYFDIKGEYTGLTSKAMTAPDGNAMRPP